MRTEEWVSLGDRAAAWDRIVDRMELPSPFLRSWWINNAATDPLVVVAVSEGDTLLGGLALQRSTTLGVETLKVAGGGPLAPDHLDVVAAPADRARVTESVGAWMGRPGSRLIDLDGVAAGSLLVGAVPGWGEVTEGDPAPFVALPATADAYLKSRPGRVRSTITRTAKRFDREGIVVERVGPDGADEALADLERLHGSRWGDESGIGGTWAVLARTARAGMERGEVWLHRLTDREGAPIAVEMEFVVGDRVGFYQAGRLTDRAYRGSGSVLRYAIVSAAIEAGCHEFDLLRGDEPYKAEWADDRRRMVRIRRGVGIRGAGVVATARLNARVAAARADRRRTDAAPGAGETPQGGPRP